MILHPERCVHRAPLHMFSRACAVFIALVLETKIVGPTGSYNKINIKLEAVVIASALDYM